MAAAYRPCAGSARRLRPLRKLRGILLMAQPPVLRKLRKEGSPLLLNPRCPAHGLVGNDQLPAGEGGLPKLVYDGTTIRTLVAALTALGIAQAVPARR
jgi:hypothetical protein